MLFPSPHEKAPQSIRRSHRLLSRIKPVAEVLAPTSEFEAALGLLESRYDEWILSRRALTVAIGAQKQAEESLDKELRGVGLAILAEGKGRRSYEVCRKYFPNGYGKVLRLSPEESIAVAAGLSASMEDETAWRILACRGPLAAARAALEGALAARQTAVNARSAAKILLDEEKFAWRKALMKFYFACRYAFADHRSYVESLFRMSDGRSSEEDEEPNDLGEEDGDERDSTPVIPLDANMRKIEALDASAA
jgi:hypothetical protein